MQRVGSDPMAAGRIWSYSNPDVCDVQNILEIERSARNFIELEDFEQACLVLKQMPLKYNLEIPEELVKSLEDGRTKINSFKLLGDFIAAFIKLDQSNYGFELGSCLLKIEGTLESIDAMRALGEAIVEVMLFGKIAEGLELADMMIQANQEFAFSSLFVSIEKLMMNGGENGAIEIINSMLQRDQKQAIRQMITCALAFPPSESEQQSHTDFAMQIIPRMLETNRSAAIHELRAVFNHRFVLPLDRNILSLVPDLIGRAVDPNEMRLIEDIRDFSEDGNTCVPS